MKRKKQQGENKNEEKPKKKTRRMSVLDKIKKPNKSNHRTRNQKQKGSYNRQRTKADCTTIINNTQKNKENKKIRSPGPNQPKLTT